MFIICVLLSLWNLVTQIFFHKAIVSGHFLILGEQGLFYY